MKIPQKTAHTWPYKGLEKPRHELGNESGQLESHCTPCSSFIFCSRNEY